MPKVTEQPLQRQLDKGQSRRRRRKFDVQAFSDEEALIHLANEKGVAEGAFYQDDFGVIDRSVTAQEFSVKPASVAPVGQERLYRIDVRYTPGKGDPSEPDKRVGAPPVFVWSRAEQSIDVEKDRNDNAVKNSKGELYDPPPTQIVPHRNLQVKWYQSSVNLSELFTLDGVANADEWRPRGTWTVKQGQALSHGIDPQEEEPGLIKLTWQIEFRPGGKLWAPLKIIDYTNENGKRILLDGNGKRLPDGNNPVFNEFNVYETVKFTGTIQGG